MSNQLEDYYLKFPEPYQSCLLALKQIIMNVDDQIMHVRKYQIPFFYYGKKKLAFLWMNRKKLTLGFVTDKSVLPETQVKLKDHLELIVINPTEDLPKEMIEARLRELIRLYQTA